VNLIPSSPPPPLFSTPLLFLPYSFFCFLRLRFPPFWMSIPLFSLISSCLWSSPVQAYPGLWVLKAFFYCLLRGFPARPFNIWADGDYVYPVYSGLFVVENAHPCRFSSASNYFSGSVPKYNCQAHLLPVCSGNPVFLCSPSTKFLVTGCAGLVDGWVFVLLFDSTRRVQIVLFPLLSKCFFFGLLEQNFDNIW